MLVNSKCWLIVSAIAVLPSTSVTYGQALSQCSGQYQGNNIFFFHCTGERFASGLSKLLLGLRVKVTQVVPDADGVYGRTSGYIVIVRGVTKAERDADSCWERIRLTEYCEN